MCEWEGRPVNVTVREDSTSTSSNNSILSCYQGTIVCTDGISITITKPFKDGFPYHEPIVHLRAENIENIELIDGPIGGESPNEKNYSTVPKVTKSAKKLQKPNTNSNCNAVNDINFQVPSTSQSLPNSTPNGKFSHQNGHQNHREQNQTSNRSHSAVANEHYNATQGKDYAKSKPIDIQNQQCKTNGNGYMGGTPQRKTNNNNRQRSKNDVCFGTPSDDPLLNEDFDFEKNLALFDKQAIWEQLKQKPDLSKQTGNAKSNGAQQKLKHTENVIEPLPVVHRPIVIAEKDKGKQEYVTDDGLIIPSITSDFRKKLLTTCGKAGLQGTELLGRATSEVALQLLGGSRRLNPRNTHQAPTVAFFIGLHRQGIVGVTCAIQLASQGVSTVVLISGANVTGALRNHLHLYKLTGNKLTTNISDLPTSVDLIIVALCEDQQEQDNRQLAEWTNQSRAPVLAIDPPGNGTPGINAKYSIIPILPLAYSAENGKLYLCNLAVPIKIFKDLGIQYISPFGSKFVIALHPNDSS